MLPSRLFETSDFAVINFRSGSLFSPVCVSCRSLSLSTMPVCPLPDRTTEQKKSFSQRLHALLNGSDTNETRNARESKHSHQPHHSLSATGSKPPTVILTPSSEPQLVCPSTLLQLRLSSKSRKSPSLASSKQARTVRLCQLPILMYGEIVLSLTATLPLRLTTPTGRHLASCDKPPTVRVVSTSFRAYSS